MPSDTIGEMQFWSTFARYLDWAVEFLWVPPFVYGTIALLVALPLTIWKSWTSIRHNWKPKHWLMFLQFVFFPGRIGCRCTRNSSFNSMAQTATTFMGNDVQCRPLVGVSSVRSVLRMADEGTSPYRVAYAALGPVANARSGAHRGQCTEWHLAVNRV